MSLQPCELPLPSHSIELVSSSAAAAAPAAFFAVTLALLFESEPSLFRIITAELRPSSLPIDGRLKPFQSTAPNEENDDGIA